MTRLTELSTRVSQYIKRPFSRKMHGFSRTLLVTFTLCCIVLGYFSVSPNFPSNQELNWQNITQINVSHDHQIPIPRNIIQTGKSSFHKPRLTQTFIRLNPHHAYTFYNDLEAHKFVHKHMSPEIIHAFDSMPVAVLKADYFRYISIYVLGGVYSDQDTECLRPIDTWTDNFTNVSFIVGVEAEGSVARLGIARPLQLCQWTFAAKPEHPILKRMIEKIENQTKKLRNSKLSISLVMEWTGPGLWTDVVFDYLNETYGVQWHTLQRLQYGRLIGDVYFLPITAFQPDARDLGARGRGDREARVAHHFHGSWKRGLSKQ